MNGADALLSHFGFGHSELNFPLVFGVVIGIHCHGFGYNNELDIVLDMIDSFARFSLLQ